MNGENKQLISDEDEELKHIKQKKLEELMRLKEKKPLTKPEPVHVTDSNFSEIMNKNALALIDCWASWCAPCVYIAPIVEELAKDYAGKVFVGKLNVDENPRTANQFQVMGIPTLLIMKSGREVDRIVGVTPKSHIEARLKKHME